MREISSSEKERRCYGDSLCYEYRSEKDDGCCETKPLTPSLSTLPCQSLPVGL